MKEKEIIRKNGKDVEVEYAPVLLDVFIGDLSLAGELNTSIFKHKDIPEDMYLLMGGVQSQNSNRRRVYVPMEEFGKGYCQMPKKLDLMGGAFPDPYVTAKNTIKALNDIISKNKKNAYGRTAKIMKNELELSQNPNFYDALLIDPLYKSYFGSLLASFPDNKFQVYDPVTKEPLMTTDKETGKTVPLVEVDNARFEKLMNKYPFLEFVEFSQNFFMNEVIPYVKAKKEGKLTQKKINEFKNKYNKHITERNKIIEKFKDAYEENDPDLKDNKTFIVNSKLMDVRYKGPLLESTHAAEDMQKCLANGWAVEDLPLLQQIKTWYIGTERELDDNSIGEAEKAKDREILAACKKDYEALFNTEITTPEIRKELLTNIKVHTDKTNLKGVTNPLDIALTLAINAPVTKMEVGTGFIPKAKTEKKAEPKKEEKKPAPKKEEKKVEEKKVEPKKEEKKPAPKKEEKKVEEKKVEPKKEEKKPAPKKEEKKVEEKKVEPAKEEKKVEPKKEEKQPVSIGKFKINKLVDTTSELYNQIKGVDFFMFGRGSKEFDKMLEALKYADEKGKSLKSDPASLAEVVEFGDELIKAKEAVRDYLVHKEVDFEKDKNRRDKEDGKKREQPRIKAALDAYEKLDTMINNTRRTVENAVRPVVQAAVENKIKLEEKFREKEKDPNKYMASIIRTADLMAKNEDVAYKIPSTLTFNGYMTRMNNKATVTYTKREVEDLYKYNKNMRTIVDTLMPGEVSEKNPKPLPQYLVTNENIKVVYKQQLKKMAQKNAGKKSAAMDDELARFKENLIAKPVNKHEKDMKGAGPILPGM